MTTQTKMRSPIRRRMGVQVHAAVAVKVHDNVNLSPAPRCVVQAGRAVPVDGRRTSDGRNWTS